MCTQPLNVCTLDRMNVRSWTGLRLHDLCLPGRLWFASLFVLDLNGGDLGFPALILEFHSCAVLPHYPVVRTHNCTLF